MNHKLAKGMKMWKGNGNTTILLFSLKGLEILYQKGEDKGTPWLRNTSTAFSSTSPDLLTNSIPMTQSWDGAILDEEEGIELVPTQMDNYASNVHEVKGWTKTASSYSWCGDDSSSCPGPYPIAPVPCFASV